MHQKFWIYMYAQIATPPPPAHPREHAPPSHWCIIKQALPIPEMCHRNVGLCLKLFFQARIFDKEG